MIPKAVETWLAEEGFGTVTKTRSVGGGCINHGQVLGTSSGRSFFLKTNHSCPSDMFQQEVLGLKSMAVQGGPRVPQPYLHGVDFLLMEDLAPARSVKDYWQTFGHQMAVLHGHTHHQFGFSSDNYIGSTPQPNRWEADGFAFYRDQRFVSQAQLAVRRGLLSPSEAAQVEKLANKLPDLVPEQPASILHGDLWSGNSTTDQYGQPAIIDPAAYYGWAEADLAMMVLFGSPGSGFWEAYQEVRTLAKGWQDRFPLYNLYHVLNHLNLFGRGYHAQAMGLVRRFL